MAILDVLAEKNIINAKDIAPIQKEARESGSSIEEVLSKRGVSPSEILQAKGESFGMPVRNLEDQNVPFEILKYVPEESTIYYKFVPIDVKDGVLEVGIVDPDNIEARDALNFISTKINMPYKLFLISEASFQNVLQIYKGLSAEVNKALSELETELQTDVNKIETEKSPVAESEEIKGKETKIIEDAPVTKIVATILHYATEGDASDIHIEPTDSNVRVRFRVDGELNTSLILPLKVHSAVVARIKILSNMRLDEKRKPQDGRFKIQLNNEKVSFRVSTLPTHHGEKTVMRLLRETSGGFSLESRGFHGQGFSRTQRHLRCHPGSCLKVERRPLANV